MSAPLSALSGLRILDLTTLWPGPLATMLLADLGAEVVRVEAPDRPDLLRYLPPVDADGEGAAWRMVNRNKRSLALNLKHPDGRQVLRRLVQHYDIVVEQFRPGVLDRLGCGYADLVALQPRLIWCAISGYGQHGPWRDRPGHDINFLANSGLAHHMGRHGPTPWVALPGDVAGGTWPAVAGILAAVIQRQATGRGQLVDIAMADGALFLNAMAASAVLAGGPETEAGQGMLGGGSAYDYYPTRDGRWLAVGALEPKFWQTLCTVIGRPDLLDGSLQGDALKASLAQTLASRDWADWQALLDGSDCCVEPLRTTTEALALPQYAARQMVAEVPAGDATVRQLGNPIRLGDSPPRYQFAAVPPGHDSDAVLRDAGFSEAERRALAGAGVTAA
jgi:crotonobetainyl-CoA:carnitine CoA-transferase CaiB-like acyl-CoA transferase